MGGGASKAKAKRGGGPALPHSPKDLPREVEAQLASLVQAAGRASSLSEAKLDGVLAALAAAEAADSGAWLAHHLAKATAKPRAGMLLLLQRTLARALEASVVVAEELVANEEGEAADFLNFGHLEGLCKDALALDETHRQAVLIAVLALDGAAITGGAGGGGGLEESPGQYIVPALDRIVLLFRHALLANIGGSARNLQRWQEFEEVVGLPPLEQHLAVLSCSSKAVLLSLRLVPDGVPPTAIVVGRERALLDAVAQLPKEHACVLLPYFESSAGTKVVQGRRVEGGEGHGPRKEFFTAASADALRRWGEPQVAPPAGVPVAAAEGVACSGSSVTLGEAGGAGQKVRECLAQAKAGDKIRLEFADGSEAERLVTLVRCCGTSAVLVVSERFEPVEGQPAAVSRCAVQRPVLPLFEFHRGTGQHWFSAYAAELSGPRGQELRSRFRCFGKLLALGVANNCRISFTLPVMFFRVLLRGDAPTSLADLQGFDDALHASLNKCLRMKQAQFTSLKELDGLPVDLSREDYVAAQVKAVLSPEAMAEVRGGFWSLAAEDLLRGVTASDLRQMVCPTDAHKREVDIRRIFKVAMEEEMAECDVFVDAFWAVVDGFSAEEKRLFLLFVTGVETPPEPGTERLQIELPFSAFSRQEYEAMVHMLPQAHTCSNTLELPNYHDALRQSGLVTDEQGPEVLARELRRVLGEKLRLAIRESRGYELDAIVSQEGTAAPSAVPVTTAETQGGEAKALASPISRPVAGGLQGLEPRAAPHPVPRNGSWPPLGPPDVARPGHGATPRSRPQEKTPEASLQSQPERPEGVAQEAGNVVQVKADVDSLLQDCGLLSLLVDEQQSFAAGSVSSPAGGSAGRLSSGGLATPPGIVAAETLTAGEVAADVSGRLVNRGLSKLLAERDSDSETEALIREGDLLMASLKQTKGLPLGGKLSVGHDWAGQRALDSLVQDLEFSMGSP